jgi:tetratricopeptide (TPR) repeat protein
MTISRNTIIVFVLLFFLCSPLQLYCGDREIGLYYFKQAEVLYHSGKIKEAERLLKTSYEFYPDFSETTFLLSLIYFKNQKTTLTGLSFLRQAIEDNTWTTTDPYIPQRELGRVYLQIKLLNDAQDVFQSMGSKLKEDPSSALLMAKTLKESDSPRFEGFLSDSLRRFPSYSEFYTLYAGYLIEEGKIEKAGQIINQGLEKLPDNPNLILVKIQLLSLEEMTETIENPGETGNGETEETSKSMDESPGRGKQLLDSYYEKGGQSPLASILALSLESGDPNFYLNLFFTLGGNNDILFLDQMARLVNGNEELSTMFTGKITDYTGVRIVDENRDGFYEEAYTYKTGNLVLWQQDNNQDGVTEREITFKDTNNREPARISFYSPGDRAVNGNYSTYPYLESIGFDGQKGTKEYFLLPLDYPYPIFREVKPGEEQILRLPVREILIPPAETMVITRAFRVYEYKNGEKASVSEFLNGEYVTVSRDTDEDGHMDHIIDYKNGKPDKGKQDLDGDGYYEIIEYYTDGWLEKITYDYNRDDYPDCIQFYNKAGENLETHWDYNSDGMIDAREATENDGKTVFLFSTGYNGRYDLRIIFQGGKVIEARRGDTELPVLPGAQPGIYWIGKRGKNIDVPLLSGSGLYYSKGNMYFIFTYKNNTYIEEYNGVDPTSSF